MSQDQLCTAQVRGMTRRLWKRVKQIWGQPGGLDKGQEKELAVSLTEEQEQDSAVLLTKEQWTDVGHSTDWGAKTGVVQTAEGEPLASVTQATWKPETDGMSAGSTLTGAVVIPERCWANTETAVLLANVEPRDWSGDC